MSVFLRNGPIFEPNLLASIRNFCFRFEARFSLLVKVLGYEPEGRGFKIR
jgi:hypothetical protein